MNKNNIETPSPETSFELAPVDIQTKNILVLHFKLGMSVESIANIFSLTVNHVEEKISNFSRQFSNRTFLMNVINALASMKNKDVKPQSVNTPQTDKDAEIADLKRRLKDEQIKAEAFEEMVRLAEIRFGIPIRKKYGAK